MTLKPLHIIIAGVFLLSGCSGPQYISTQIPTTITSTTPISLLRSPTMEAWTPTSTFTPNPTATPVSAIATLTPTAATTADPVSGIRTQCLENISPLPEDVTLQGYLVLGDNFFNPETHAQRPLIPNVQSMSGHEISPDQNHILLEYCVNNECTNAIASLNGVVATFHIPENMMFEAWLDNERLIIFTRNQVPSNTIPVLNPFSGEEEDLSLDLPNPYYAVNPDNFYIFPIDIDPTLTRVIYSDSQGIGRIIMWDIPNSKILAWLPYSIPHPPGLPPDYFLSNGWSPDGSQYITTSPVVYSDTEKTTPAAEEIFTISRDGLVRQLTHVSEAYNFVIIRGLTWSPDGRYVAFWLHADNIYYPPTDRSWRLAVLDTNTQEIFDYCFSSHGIAGGPFWSPDSQSLVIEIFTEDLREPLILIDPINLFAYTISEDLFPVLYGWMTSP